MIELTAPVNYIIPSVYYARLIEYVLHDWAPPRNIAADSFLKRVDRAYPGLVSLWMMDRR